jgi:next-to-BRCA1 protein 1
MEPNQKFVKIWRMRNEGASVWEDNTCLVFVGGDTLSSSDAIVVPVNVQPGQEVDLSIDMVAPSKPGRYVGYYRLQVPDGTRFGQRVWVDVFVNNTATPAPSAPVAEEKKVEQQEQPKEDTTPALQPTPVTPAPVEAVPSTPAPAPVIAEVPVFTPSAPPVEEEKDSSEMTQLVEMGFANRELNKTLLAKHNNNMLRTIQELLQL